MRVEVQDPCQPPLREGMFIITWLAWDVRLPRRPTLVQFWLSRGGAPVVCSLLGPHWHQTSREGGRASLPLGVHESGYPAGPQAPGWGPGAEMSAPSKDWKVRLPTGDGERATVLSVGFLWNKTASSASFLFFWTAFFQVLSLGAFVSAPIGVPRLLISPEPSLE